MRNSFLPDFNRNARPRVKPLCVILLLAGLVLSLGTQAYGANLPAVSETDSLKAVLAKPLKPADKIKSLAALGKAYYNQSDLDNALKTEYQLLEVVSQHGSKKDSAALFRLLGLIYMQKSWYDKALDNFEKSQQLFGESGDSSKQAKAFMNIGIVHDYLQNLPMAISFYEKALSYFTRKQELPGIADCKLNIAIVLTKQKKYQQACEYLLSAAEIYSKNGNTTYLAAAYINLGLTYKKMGDYDRAIEYHNKALVLWQQADDQYHISYYYMNMGEIMLDLGRINEAGEYLRQAEELALKTGSKDLLAKTYEFLSDYNAARKNFALAYSYLDKSKQLNDSILNAETTEKVSQIHYQYEIARRDADNSNLVKENLDQELKIQKKNYFLYLLTGTLLLIAILVIFLVRQNRIKHKANKQLEEKNRLIIQQKDELVKLNASKDKFLTILAHDIKNPLSSIHGLSEMWVTDFDTLTEKEKMVFAKDIHALSTNLFEIINTLLTWSTSQSGMITYKPKSFAISELCRKATRNLQTVAKQKDILIVSKSDENLMVMADENMILSVMHNLVNNAIKYSHPGTSIHIEARRADEKAEVSVIDSGIGLSDESIAKLFRYDQHFMNKGTAGEAGTGLGLILCKDFVEKNGGAITVESTLNRGSRFTFTLPLAV